MRFSCARIFLKSFSAIVTRYSTQIDQLKKEIYFEHRLIKIKVKPFYFHSKGNFAGKQFWFVRITT